MIAALYSILEHRGAYNLSQAILAPGGVENLKQRLAPHLRFPAGRPHRVLELGCGTGYFSLRRDGVSYVGTDINGAYFPAPEVRGAATRYAVMDATRLGFPDAHFDVVYSIGLYHHLTDAQVGESLREARRVLAPRGRIVLVDNIWPTRAWNVPAWLVRRLDRGGHVRTQRQIEQLTAASALRIEAAESFTYTVTGLEGVILRLQP